MDPAVAAARDEAERTGRIVGSDLDQVEHVLLGEPKEVRAGCVPLTVVAAKKPGHWIIRGFSPFRKVEELRKAVEGHVGTQDPEIEWTSYAYEGWPGYVVYGKGDLPRLGWPVGIFRFRWLADDTYDHQAERLGSL